MQLTKRLDEEGKRLGIVETSQTFYKTKLAQLDLDILDENLKVMFTNFEDELTVSIKKRKSL